MEISQDPWSLGLLWKPNQVVCFHHWIYSYIVSLIHVLSHIWRSPTDQSWSSGSQALLTIKHPTLLQRVWSGMLSPLWSRWSGNATRGTVIQSPLIQSHTHSIISSFVPSHTDFHQYLEKCGLGHSVPIVNFHLPSLWGTCYIEVFTTKV